MREFEIICSVTAGDVMRKDVVTLSPEDTLEKARRTLLEHQVSSVPVTDAENQVVGVISEFALMDLLFDPQLKDAPISQFMIREVHTVEEKDEITRLAHIFARHQIRRLPVLRDKKLVGMVSRRDLLRHFADSESGLEEPLAALGLNDLDD